jgi:hypothetical protein
LCGLTDSTNSPGKQLPWLKPHHQTRRNPNIIVVEVELVVGIRKPGEQVVSLPPQRKVTSEVAVKAASEGSDKGIISLERIDRRRSILTGVGNSEQGVSNRCYFRQGKGDLRANIAV